MSEVEAKLIKICRDWASKHKVVCAEDIWQRDGVIETLPDLVEKIFDLIGWEVEKGAEL